MLVDGCEVRKHIKPKADSTLQNMRKSGLIEYIRCLEHNYNVAVSFNENQAKYVESLGTLPKWIPVSERLPEKDVKVLTFGVYGFSVNYRDRFSGKWRGVNGKPQWITHWMPLPEPPK